jgi:hypothetical protein
LSLQAVLKSGAVVSSIGTILLITFAVILFSFPVLKKCQGLGEKCEFFSTAPEPLNSLINPSFLVIALLTIAAGVSIIRFGTWYRYKKARNNIS